MEFPIAYGLSKTGLPLILSEDNVCFIIDTGATNNTLFRFVYEHFKDKFKVLDATDAVMTVQEESGIQIHGVLGTSFFVENKWVIDFKNCVVRED